MPNTLIVLLQIVAIWFLLVISVTLTWVFIIAVIETNEKRRQQKKDDAIFKAAEEARNDFS